MSRERGSMFNGEIPNTSDLIKDAREFLSEVDASLLPENNPSLVAIFEELGLPYPTTLEEWRHAEAVLDRRVRERQSEAQTKEERLSSGQISLTHPSRGDNQQMGTYASRPQRETEDSRKEAQTAAQVRPASAISKEQEFSVQMERLRAAESRLKVAEAKTQEMDEQLRTQPERFRQQDAADDAAFEEKKRKLLEEIARLSK